EPPVPPGSFPSSVTVNAPFRYLLQAVAPLKLSLVVRLHPGTWVPLFPGFRWSASTACSAVSSLAEEEDCPWKLPAWLAHARQNPNRPSLAERGQPRTEPVPTNGACRGSYCQRMFLTRWRSARAGQGQFARRTHARPLPVRSSRSDSRLR